MKCFNPHFRKGSDTFFQIPLENQSRFNPHFRKGSDLCACSSLLVTLVSIHTSAREVTLLTDTISCIVEVSIHTSAREVTANPNLGVSVQWVSIHTSAREVTWERIIGLICDHGFNPHFRKGSDRNRYWIILAFRCFNPHFRKGSDGDAGHQNVIRAVSIHTSAREVTKLLAM